MTVRSNWMKSIRIDSFWQKWQAEDKTHFFNRRFFRTDQARNRHSARIKNVIHTLASYLIGKHVEIKYENGMYCFSLLLIWHSSSAYVQVRLSTDEVFLLEWQIPWTEKKIIERSVEKKCSLLLLSFDHYPVQQVNTMHACQQKQPKYQEEE